MCLWCVACARCLWRAYCVRGVCTVCKKVSVACVCVFVCKGCGLCKVCVCSTQHEQTSYVDQKTKNLLDSHLYFENANFTDQRTTIWHDTFQCKYPRFRTLTRDVMACLLFRVFAICTTTTCERSFRAQKIRAASLVMLALVLAHVFWTVILKTIGNGTPTYRCRSWQADMHDIVSDCSKVASPSCALLFSVNLWCFCLFHLPQAFPCSFEVVLVSGSRRLADWNHSGLNVSMGRHPDDRIHCALPLLTTEMSASVVERRLPPRSPT